MRDGWFAMGAPAALAHDATHRLVAKSPIVNKIVAIRGFFAMFWMYEHMVRASCSRSNGPSALQMHRAFGYETRLTITTTMTISMDAGRAHIVKSLSRSHDRRSTFGISGWNQVSNGVFGLAQEAICELWSRKFGSITKFSTNHTYRTELTRSLSSPTHDTLVCWTFFCSLLHLPPLLPEHRRSTQYHECGPRILDITRWLSVYEIVFARFAASLALLPRAVLCYADLGSGVRADSSVHALRCVAVATRDRSRRTQWAGSLVSRFSWA